jgi:hypothetical protein
MPCFSSYYVTVTITSHSVYGSRLLSKLRATFSHFYFWWVIIRTVTVQDIPKFKFTSNPGNEAESMI